MKGQKGITLVALVITIIVMLILAGVTISIIVNGGLFNQANNAVTTTKNYTLAEAVNLAIADLTAERYDPTNTSYTTPDTSAFQAKLNSYIDGATATVTGDETTLSVTVTQKGATSVTKDISSLIAP